MHSSVEQQTVKCTAQGGLTWPGGHAAGGAPSLLTRCACGRHRLPQSFEARWPPGWQPRARWSPAAARSLSCAGPEQANPHQAQKLQALVGV